MRNVIRLLAACLLVWAASPVPAQAGGGLGEDPFEIGEKLLARKRHKTALGYFQKALRRSDPRAHYGMGRVAEETGRDGDALSEYRLFVDLAQPEDPRRGDAVQRVDAIEARLAGRIARTTGLLERGKLLFKQGKFREAEKALLQAAAADDAQPEVHFQLGEVYLALEEYAKAESEYQKAKRRY